MTSTVFIYTSNEKLENKKEFVFIIASKISNP